MHADTRRYNAAQAPGDRKICKLLAQEIERALPEAENKVWHRHPVWFLEGNPIVVGPDAAELDAAAGDAYTAAFDPEGETGAELLEGYTYKEGTGVAFDSSSEGSSTSSPS